MIINKDCLEYLKTLPENSVDAVVSDPPYGLSFMGKKWDYDVPSVEIWQECLRVLKPGGYLLAFAGIRTQHRMAVRIEDAGFEIRDMIAWIYGSGFPKSLNIGKAVDKLWGNERVASTSNVDCEWLNKGDPCKGHGDNNGRYGETVHATPDKGTSEWEGWGTALKPALEPITVARKPLSENTVAENCLKWGVGGINIDGCRVEAPNEDTGRNNKSDVADTNTVGNWGMKAHDSSGRIGQGRFPANLIHDGSEEVLGLFPNTKSNARPNQIIQDREIFEGVTYKPASKRIPAIIDDSGSAARFFYCAKASKSERNRGCEDLPKKAGGSNAKGYTEDVANGVDRNAPVSNFHPTVKPIALMEYLVKLVSKEGHTVLDPFTGSGTTGVACKNLNRNFIGVERDEEYCKIAEARINACQREH